MDKLLLGTSNPSKLLELRQLLKGLEYRFVDPTEVKLKRPLQIAETGATFEENAAIKAQGYAAASGLLTLADDSGLEIEALGGEPGVYSARYGGEELSYPQRFELILERLLGCQGEQRRARFRCVMALATPKGDLTCWEASLDGLIALQPRGDGGFGYDPIFYVPELGATLAEARPGLKNLYSHRGRAALKARQVLELRMAGARA
ncbi:MAG: RdgB/HAM1 family non-canonical purine NTP pyrophosphatase [Dehalococcoidia bacterium]|nr:RdgB/HAM1 family non-canonical purine NTP pyrophosphatase [Dehalococcoidia bacterium]